MPCVIVVVIIGIAIGIAIASRDRRRERSEIGNLREELGRGFTVTIAKEKMQVPELPEPLEVYSVSVHGTLSVPRANTSCELVVRILDETADLERQSEEDIYPALCTIGELSAEHGVFEARQPTVVPHQVARFEAPDMLKVPTSALVFPKKGRRRALVCAFMVPTGDGGQPYCYGERIFTHDQSFYGYLEYEQRDAAFDRAVLSLALSLGAAGGAIGRAEAGVLRAYRAERLTGLEGEEATRRRAHIDEVIAGFTEAITRQGRSARELWEESCRQVTDAGDDQVSLEAYELALRLATADGRATREELEMLKATAGRLGIPPEADRELRDRYFKLAMFEERKAQHVLDMPEGLSRQEQIDFLNREYRKWRGRATHPDPEMAAEATARLERIAAARRALEES